MLTETGGYTFGHQFHDNGNGMLAVTMALLDPEEEEIATWTLSGPSNIIGTTGRGNRYGWFPVNEFAFVAINDSNQSS